MSLINYEYHQSLRKNALKMLEKAKELERIKKENEQIIPPKTKRGTL